MRYIKILFYTIIAGAILSVISIILANYTTNTTNTTTATSVYESLDEVPECKSALLLGTSKHLRSGVINPYFAYRIYAAVELFNSGKISYIVISGDNSRKDYNEPQDMKDALVGKGIPANKIVLDYAGFNTYDSVHRMNKIFSQDKFIIISQKFHNQRAVYIAKSAGLEAYGYNAQNVDRYLGFKVNMREKLARVKMFLDLIINREPHFLGDKINLDS